jgi:hypothetical protein
MEACIVKSKLAYVWNHFHVLVNLVMGSDRFPAMGEILPHVGPSIDIVWVCRWSAITI